ncbi:aminotransferase class I/II-fold pyridoxal phosphate-dependent enzyme [Streptomyces sp. PKU-EA00015]|uniref:threonine aldolase family protein n=1 Tax=Streptomyces sp. PKU-EA00015 TaxID=2748326 RepID=UPI0015A2E810|nr:GntG family PLP-dependent aldolase [Streptomyces sp. PKU-EA00015]NWF28796.1 aminotransferase class I/II-fold pyridoxal phosphate-dependent enzyme [Streptomyces sp. PKU-EA00015]
MTAETVDLRSDTVTRPTPGMRRAMATAEVGDDLFGEDPTVRALEERVAGLFGFPGALFVPSGVMANQIALRLLAAPGQEVVCDAEAHILAHEEGSPARYGGIQTRTVSGERGLVGVEALAGILRPGNAYTVGTRAVALEQTHTRAGGTVYPLETLRAVRGLTSRAGIALHIDGARIWNAHAATGTPLAEYGAPVADTLAVCLSKGLGAPVGSVLLTSAEHLPRARSLRHGLGGGMRQSGILAAAGLHALDHHLERIAEDHENAALLADGLREAGFPVRPRETNIVLVDTPGAEDVVARAAREGVLVTAPGPGVVRLVTHLDVGRQACLRAVEVLTAVMGEGRRGTSGTAAAEHTQQWEESEVAV